MLKKIFGEWRMGLLDRRIRRRGSAARSPVNFDQVLFVLCVTVFFILILVQTALISPTVKDFLEAQNEYEGRPLGTEEYLYSEGALALRLNGEQPNEKIKVLVNGDTVAAFSANTVAIRVRDGDVVEIDASEDMDEHEIEIVSQSDNIITECTGMKLVVKSEVKMLVRVRVE